MKTKTSCYLTVDRRKQNPSKVSKNILVFFLYTYIKVYRLERVDCSVKKKT